ncbi:MAG: DUF3568 domain-containing protein [Thermodesulfobacteriota bacterium]
MGLKTNVYGYVLGVLALVVLSSGCAAVALGTAGGAGTYVYLKGQLVREYNAGMDRSYDAVLSTCNALDLEIQSRSHNLSEAKVSALDGDRTVHFRLKSLSTQKTKLSVRVGLLGDKVASQRIHEEFSRQL